jgi:hypothetical protein
LRITCRGERQGPHLGLPGCTATATEPSSGSSPNLDLSDRLFRPGLRSRTRPTGPWPAWPPGVSERAAAAARCDLLLAIGGTLTVEPAASLCGIAVGSGASLVIVHRDPTPCDPAATAVIRDPIGQAVPRLADQLLAASPA